MSQGDLQQLPLETAKGATPHHPPARHPLTHRMGTGRIQGGVHQSPLEETKEVTPRHPLVQPPLSLKTRTTP